MTTKMYLITTPYEMFAFESAEDLNDFLRVAILPEHTIAEVEPSPLYERMALDTRWRMA